MTTYHLNQKCGDDGNDGLSKEMPLKSFERVQQLASPGDSIRLYGDYVESELGFDPYLRGGKPKQIT